MQFKFKNNMILKFINPKKQLIKIKLVFMKFLHYNPHIKHISL